MFERGLYLSQNRAQQRISIKGGLFLEQLSDYQLFNHWIYTIRVGTDYIQSDRKINK